VYYLSLACVKILIGTSSKRSIATLVSTVAVTRVGADSAAWSWPSCCQLLISERILMGIAGLKDVTNPDGGKDDTQQTFWYVGLNAISA
jgi:hypothetical protein